MDVRVGDIVTLKKEHPCRSYTWEVLRIGMDYKLRCSGCGHEIMVPRGKIEKRIKSIERRSEDNAP